MSGKSYRPRTTRDRRDKVVKAAERLNGDDVSGLHEALGLFCSYLDVLNGQVTCPECGSEDVESGNHGTYRCWRCDRDGRLFNVWDVIDADHRDNAELPGLPEGIKSRFGCGHDDHQGGTNGDDSGQEPQSQGAANRNGQLMPWDNS